MLTSLLSAGFGIHGHHRTRPPCFFIIIICSEKRRAILQKIYSGQLKQMMQIFLVGGAVRDTLLNYPFTERDWVVVGATPEQLLDQGYQQVGKDFPVFLHPKTKEEYALARTEKKSGSGYHGFICDFGPDVSLEEDLQRRDLTINAIAQTDSGELIDPYGGQQDLRDRILRHVSPAFSEDPLRVLRVARFAARYAHLNFTLATETLALMQKMSDGGELATLTPERVWIEINKGLSSPSPAVFFQVLQDCGALRALYPSWSASLNPDIFTALNRAANQNASNEIRFAISTARMSRSECQALCEQIKATNAASDLALLAVEQLPLPQPLDANASLALLERLDYLRRPQRLSDFAQLVNILQRGDESRESERTLQRLPQASQQLGSIKAEQLIAQGFKGAALGKALRQQRLTLLEKILGAD